MSNHQFDSAEVAANVRRISGIPSGTGPSDNDICNAVNGYIQAFEYWYIRVIGEAVAEYRKLIIQRINLFVRRMELEGASPDEAAEKLVDDYNSRNFVTAGGWAIEELASKINPVFQKSPAEGIDLQRADPATGDFHLYVIKSGLVTRNSDIVKALKRNAKSAEKLLKQGRGTRSVHANYAIASGKTSSTFEDGVKRPSSAEFWGEVTGLPEDQAMDMVLAIAAEAGRLVQRDAREHIAALKTLVAEYIRAEDGSVDWEFIAQRNSRVKTFWEAEDRVRHIRALQKLKSTGYIIKRRPNKTKGS